MSSFDLEIDRQDGQSSTVSVKLAGELDLFTAGRLEECLDEIEQEEPQHLVLDLCRLAFLDSTGLRSIILAEKRARSGGRQFTVVSSAPTINRLLQLTGVDRQLTVVASPEQLTA